MAVVPVPKQPGRYFDTSTGKYVDIVDYHDADRYDTVRLASGAVTAGTEINLFKDLSSKDKIDANISQTSRLSQGEEMLVRRVGFDIPLCFGDTRVAPADIKRVAYGAYCEVKLNDKIIAEGPLYTMPSGYGLAGQTNENAAGIVSVGVASTAAQRQLEKTHWLTSNQDITGTVKFFDHTWDVANMPTTASRVHIRAFIGGLVRLRK